MTAPCFPWLSFFYRDAFPGYRNMLRYLSEIVARRELHEPRLDNSSRAQPRCAKCIDLRQDRVGVAEIVDVEVRLEPALAAHVEDLRRAKVDLIQTIAINRARLDDVDGGLVRQERGASQPLHSAGRDVGVRVDDVRAD